MDGDNPFRPEGDLYKEADEVVKQYTLPRGSGTPSPLPDDVRERLDQNGHIDNTETTAVSHADIHLSSPSRDRITSSSESSHSGGQTVINHPQRDLQPSDSQSGADHVVEKPTPARRQSSADVEPSNKRHSNPDNNIPPDRKKRDKKSEKKKKKPVGCGGDKRCSIM